MSDFPYEHCFHTNITNLAAFLIANGKTHVGQTVEPRLDSLIVLFHFTPKGDCEQLEKEYHNNGLVPVNEYNAARTRLQNIIGEEMKVAREKRL